MGRPVAIAFAALCVAGVCVPAWAMDLTLTGSWSVGIDASDLQSGAGSDLVDTHDSSTTEISIDISNASGDSDAWRVDVRRSDSNWDSGILVYVRRTGAGTGTGSISGGATFQEVTGTDASLFTGEGDRSGVTVQVRISGMGVDVPADAYATSLFYTVVDT